MEQHEADSGAIRVASGHGAAARVVDGRITVALPPGRVERVVPLQVSRDDGAFFTQIERASSRYRC